MAAPTTPVAVTAAPDPDDHVEVGRAVAARRSWTFRVLVAAIVVGVALLLANLLSADQSGDTPSSASETTGSPEPDSGVLAPGSLGEAGGSVLAPDQAASFWRERVERQPGDFISATNLAISLNELARLNGDSLVAAEAELVLAEVVAEHPDFESAQVALATARISSHDFAGAATITGAILREDPRNPAALAVATDAAIELGNLNEAAGHLDALAAVTSAPAVTSRQARIAWLTGDPDLAVSLSERAVSEAELRALRPDQIGWYGTQVGLYLRLTGDHEGAVIAYERALELRPNDAATLYGTARSTAAMGDLPAAIVLGEEAVAVQPNPEFLGFLADLYTLSGDSERAETQLATAEVALRLAAVDGETIAAFRRVESRLLADRGLDSGRALLAAEADFAERSDIYTFDTLAWALLADGQSTEALRVLDGFDGPLPADATLAYHRGRIELANGLASRGAASIAEALAIDPAFDPLHGIQAYFIAAGADLDDETPS